MIAPLTCVALWAIVFWDGFFGCTFLEFLLTFFMSALTSATFLVGVFTYLATFSMSSKSKNSLSMSSLFILFFKK